MVEMIKASQTPTTPRIEQATSQISTNGRFSLLRTPSKLPTMTETQEAELIAKATAQAMIAARSIILSGGTQATALSTAKAAAQSVIAPKSSPQTPGSSSNFIGRRKAKRQATIIASMALGSVNNSLQYRTNDTNETRRDFSIDGPTRWDAAKMLLQGIDMQANVGNDVDSFFQDSRYSMHSESRAAHISYGSKPPSSPQPSAMATTTSGSQGTTPLSSTIGSIGKSEARTAEIEASNKASLNTELDGDVQPNVASILTSLASLSDIGSKNSPGSGISGTEHRANGIVGYIKNKKKSDQADPGNRSSLRKLPEEMPLPRSRTRDLVSKIPSAEDPIYIRKLKNGKKPEYNKPFVASKRMEQFLQSSSYDSFDSFSGDSSTYGSHYSASQYTEEGTDDAGTADSGTEESVTIGSTTYHGTAMSATIDEHDTFFGIPSSNVFNTLSEAFFCSPVPRLTPKESKMSPVTENRDEEETVKDIGTTTFASFKDHYSAGSMGSSIFERETLTDGDEGEEEEVEKVKQKQPQQKKKQPESPVKEEVTEPKMSSIQESMEQLVLRALSAAPAQPAPISNVASTGSSNLVAPSTILDATVGEKIPNGMSETLSFSQGTECGSAYTSSVKSGSLVGRRIRLPHWIGKKVMKS